MFFIVFMCVFFSPDTYVKLTLIAPNGKEVAHSKTSVRRGQPNPLFKENFMFQVALFQLADVTLMVSVYNKKSMKKKEMIGWFSLGKYSVHKNFFILLVLVLLNMLFHRCLGNGQNRCPEVELLYPHKTKFFIGLLVFLVCSIPVTP